MGRSDFWCSLYGFSQRQGLSSNNGYKVYSESTKLTIPDNSCNEEDIEEFRLDGYSMVNEVTIGDNTFRNTKIVYIEKLNELKSLKIGKESFIDNRNGMNEIHVVNCSNLNILSVNPRSFMNYKNLDLQGNEYTGCIE